MDLLNLDDTVYLPCTSGLAESLVLRLLPIRRINNSRFFSSAAVVRFSPVPTNNSRLNYRPQPPSISPKLRARAQVCSKIESCHKDCRSLRCRWDFCSSWRCFVPGSCNVPSSKPYLAPLGRLLVVARCVGQNSRREKSRSCSAGGTDRIHAEAVYSVRTPSEETNRFENRNWCAGARCGSDPYDLSCSHSNLVTQLNAEDAIAYSCNSYVAESKSAIEAAGARRCGELGWIRPQASRMKLLGASQ